MEQRQWDYEILEVHTLVFENFEDVKAPLDPNIHDWPEWIYRVLQDMKERQALRVAWSDQGFWTPLQEAMEEMGNNSWEAITTIPTGVQPYFSGTEYGILFKRPRAT